MTSRSSSALRKSTAQRKANPNKSATRPKPGKLPEWNLSDLYSGIDAPEGNYDYHHKYFSNETRYFCPSGIDRDVERAILEQSMDAFRMVGCRGWGRLDLILGDSGAWKFLEVNTSPGMTAHSLVPIAARRVGMEFPDLCVEILRGAHVG